MTRQKMRSLYVSLIIGNRRIWKKDERYKTFDPNTYYHSKGWFGTPDPEPCDKELTTAAKLYCTFRDNRPGKMYAVISKIYRR